MFSRHVVDGRRIRSENSDCKTNPNVNYKMRWPSALPRFASSRPPSSSSYSGKGHGSTCTSNTFTRRIKTCLPFPPSPTGLPLSVSLSLSSSSTAHRISSGGLGCYLLLPRESDVNFFYSLRLQNTHHFGLKIFE